ncbi:MAG: molybdopterin molybdotransferase MoeA, partial [Lachnospiraceae bacterium]|nr:molybdopterin molybdotransferase MoeA [Lachnospiraceae bacterium]
VVRQEDTDYGDDEVTIYKALQKHTNFCPVGEELEKGDLVIPAGRKIGRIETALLAEIGMHKVSVVRPAKIAILSTGSELAKVGDALKPGQIYNSILHMLGASIRQEGLRVVYAKSCGDEKEQICRELDHALEEADLVLTTGGVSVGKRDLLPYVLDEMGAKRLFHYAKIQPGTPTMGSVIDGKVILSLSGNPYAALANFDYYFWPAAAKLMNSDAFLTQTRTACLAEPYDKINRMRRLIRAFYKDGNVYLPEKKHQSSVAGNLTSCNCYIDLPAGERIVVGDSVTVRLMKN